MMSKSSMYNLVRSTEVNILITKIGEFMFTCLAKTHSLTRVDAKKETDRFFILTSKFDEIKGITKGSVGLQYLTMHKHQIERHTTY